MKNKTLVSSTELIHYFKISYQTLNYYTNLGLVRFCRRQGNKRLYFISETKKRLKRINQLKDKGYPLRLIKELIDKR